MRSLGKWLILIGFGVPFCVSVWTFTRGYREALSGTPTTQAI